MKLDQLDLACLPAEERCTEDVKLPAVAVSSSPATTCVRTARAVGDLYLHNTQGFNG